MDVTEEDNFGAYRILEVLGQGGMGTVYLAEQTEPIRRRVALKVVKLGMDTVNEGRFADPIEILSICKAYEVAQTGVSALARYGAMYPTYVCGLAYLQLAKPCHAAAEFQGMLDHPGLLADPVGPVTRLQLARSLRDSGDMAQAKAVYNEFLNLWKNANPDIPLLKQAKAEFSPL